MDNWLFHKAKENKKQFVALSSWHRCFLGKEWECGRLSWEPTSPVPNHVNKPAIYPLALQAQSGLYLHQWALGVWALRVRAMSGCYLISTDLEKLVITIEQQFRRVCNQQETKSQRRKNEWDMWDKLMYFFPPVTRCWKCVPGYHFQHSWGELLGI